MAGEVRYGGNGVVDGDGGLEDVTHVTVEVSHGSEEIRMPGLLPRNACLFPLIDHLNDDMEILLLDATQGGTDSREVRAFCSTSGCGFVVGAWADPSSYRSRQV
jgi:hypothetical protein